jgi:hypothetical protein
VQWILMETFPRRLSGVTARHLGNQNRLPAVRLTPWHKSYITHRAFLPRRRNLVCFIGYLTILYQLLMSLEWSEMMIIYNELGNDAKQSWNLVTNSIEMGARGSIVG